MAYVIEMPKLSDTMEEGGIANWLKKEGESVKVGEPLVEIETDKATQEFESPEDGVVLKILVQPGKTVGLRTPIAIVGEKGESFDLAALIGSSAKASAAPAVSAAPVGPAAAKAAPTALVSSTPAASGKTAPQIADGRVKASPLARKKAAELGINVATVAGSGPGGRVIVRDLEGFSNQEMLGANIHDDSSSAVLTPNSVAVPVTMMRKTIAKRLVAAKNEAPHFYLTVSANVSRLVEWRSRLNQDADKSGNPKVSLNDLVILGVSRALVRHPMVNASWQGDTIIQHHAAHVAVAVALPQGLVTPVIRNAHQLGLRDIARQVATLAGKAKDGKLTNEDYAGGTFSVSNLGMFGIEEFTAIINPPQAAILAVGAAIPTPWVDSKGQVTVEQRMKMTLSCDHRVVDGAMGAQFLKTLVGFLEDPMQILV